MFFEVLMNAPDLTTGLCARRRCGGPDLSSESTSKATGSEILRIC